MYSIFLKKILSGAIPGAIMAMILSISPLHASAESGKTGKCVSPPDGLSNFQATIPSKKVPAKQFFDLKGNPETLADYKGSGVVLNFWATWCIPCVREMPSLDRLAAKAGGLGLKVLTLSEDRRGIKAVVPFYKKHGIVNLDVLIDRHGTLGAEMGLRGLPMTVLIDARGKEIGRVVGSEKWDLKKNAGFLSRCLKAETAN